MDFLCCTRFHIPLDGLHPNGPHRVDGVVVIVAVGQADQGGPPAGDRLNFVVAGVQVGHHLVGRELGVVGVSIGVIHYLVACVVKSFYRFRIFIHPLAHHKESGRDLVLTQDVNQLLGILVAPG